MRERVHVNRTMKDLVADLRLFNNISNFQTFYHRIYCFVMKAFIVLL